MEWAHEQTGFDDFGDHALYAGLRALVASLQAETWSLMSASTRQIVLDYLLHQLGTRLWLIDDRKRYPQIALQKISRPLIIVGPAHSGSNLLHRLLSLDVDNMVPERWICREPSPPPALGAPSRERLVRARKRVTHLVEPSCEVLVGDPRRDARGAAALADCGHDILSMVCTSQEMETLGSGEDYWRYLVEADHGAALGFHHDFLQHIQWGSAGSRWALKGAGHGLWLRELAAQYPDAVLIWTHRDLAQQLGSLAHAQAKVSCLNGRSMAPAAQQAQGRLAIERQLATLRKAIAARQEIGETPFVDVSYRDLINDPARAVARVYEQAGLTITDAHTDAIRQWWNANPNIVRDQLQHSPEDVSMDGASIDREFGGYVERFGFSAS
jgi:hypothetical protein